MEERDKGWKKFFQKEEKSRRKRMKVEKVKKK